MSKHDQDLEATYGPAAPFSEHHRGDRIHYMSAEGFPCQGDIIWCCAAGIVGNQHMGVRYIVAPSEPGGFGLDIVWPADVRSSTESEDAS